MESIHPDTPSWVAATEMLGLRAGQASVDVGGGFAKRFKEDDSVRRNREDVSLEKRVPRSDGKAWTKKALADGDDQRYHGQQWMDTVESRRRALERDKNYRFLTLVAGHTNQDVLDLYDDTDVEREARRQFYAEQRQNWASKRYELEQMELKETSDRVMREDTRIRSELTPWLNNAPAVVTYAKVYARWFASWRAKEAYADGTSDDDAVTVGDILSGYAFPLELWSSSSVVPEDILVFAAALEKMIQLHFDEGRLTAIRNTLRVESLAEFLWYDKASDAIVLEDGADAPTVVFKFTGANGARLDYSQDNWVPAPRTFWKRGLYLNALNYGGDDGGATRVSDEELYLAWLLVVKIPLHTTFYAYGKDHMMSLFNGGGASKKKLIQTETPILGLIDDVLPVVRRAYGKKETGQSSDDENDDDDGSGGNARGLAEKYLRLLFHLQKAVATQFVKIKNGTYALVYSGVGDVLTQNITADKAVISSRFGGAVEEEYKKASEEGDDEKSLGKLYKYWLNLLKVQHRDVVVPLMYANPKDELKTYESDKRGLPSEKDAAALPKGRYIFGRGDNDRFRRIQRTKLAGQFYAGVEQDFQSLLLETYGAPNARTLDETRRANEAMEKARKRLYRSWGGALAGPESDVAHVLSPYAQAYQAFVALTALRIERAEKRLAELRERLAQLRGRATAVAMNFAGGPAADKDSDMAAPYEHPLRWRQLPENSGVIRVKAWVVSAIAAAWSKVVTAFTLKFHGAAPPFDIEALQFTEDIPIADTFAHLVATQVLSQNFNNPRQYLLQRLGTDVRRDEISVFKRLFILLERSYIAQGPPPPGQIVGGRLTLSGHGVAVGSSSSLTAAMPTAADAFLRGAFT